MTTIAQSRGLTIDGYVRNEPDGSVQMDVEGLATDIQELIQRIASAMKGNIENTITKEMPPQNNKQGFSIQ